MNRKLHNLSSYNFPEIDAKNFMFVELECVILT